MRLTSFFLLLFLFVVLAEKPYCQPAVPQNPISLFEELRHFKVFGRVLFIAAHPDDENTAVLAYCANKLGYETAYLSLTRGDGGQNIIGKEQGSDLGLIRTNELLAARKIDGARQFFTRAIDFGYSKSPEETFAKWDKEQILSDVVYAIRSFKPDIIITRFPATGEGGHGHHTASAILAEEAFALAGRNDIYPEQLSSVQPWQAKRLVWNGWGQTMKSRGINPDTLLTLDVGEYSVPFGMSYSEVAALSRTMHKSQGFGSTPQRGEQINYFLHIAGEYTNKDLFEGVGHKWNSFGFPGDVDGMINEIIANYSYEEPEKSVPALCDLYNHLNKYKLSDIQEKLEALQNLIIKFSGVWIESVSDKDSYTAGDTMKVKTTVINRRNISLLVKYINKEEVSLQTVNNKPASHSHSEIISFKTSYSNPFWLNEPLNNNLYTIPEQRMRILPAAADELQTTFVLELSGTVLWIKTPVLYKKNDPVLGETWRVPAILPPVHIMPEKPLYIFNNDDSGNVTVTVTGNTSFSGTLAISLPAGWLSTPVDYFVNNLKANEKRGYTFSVKPGSGNSDGVISFALKNSMGSFNQSYYEINYSHIPRLTVQPLAETKVLFTKLKRYKTLLGFIEGAGDKVKEGLESLGYQINTLSDNELLHESLNKYESIITGVRLFNIKENAPLIMEKLLKYVSEGGTLVVQYNTAGELKVPYAGPYPFKISRERVTEEDAAVSVTDSKSPLLTYPNIITESDFSGWIQERGLYFPSELAEQYKTLLSMADKGESAKNNSVIWNRFGKGVFIYTGISFFRQVPAGVNGALKLLVNMIEQK